MEHRAPENTSLTTETRRKEQTVKKDYTTHCARISIMFDVRGEDPDEVANEMVKDIGRAGLPAVLDDVEDVEVGSDLDLRPAFIINSLEAGHGDDFMVSFVFTRDNDCDEIFICESVDLLMKETKSGADWTPIGAVGGEVEIMAVRNSDGSINTEQMCRDWIGVWHRHFVGACEDSVCGLFLIIKQVVSEGRPLKSQH